MKNVLGLFVVVLVSQSAFAGVLGEPLKAVFLSKVALPDGNYSYLSGGDKISNTNTCLEGELKILTFADEGLTISFGARPLLEEVGNDNFVVPLGPGHSFHFGSDYKQGSVHGIQLDIRAGQPAVRTEVTIKITSEGFDYYRVVNRGSKLMADEVCSLKRN